MPELPEVENIRIQLDKFLQGHVIKKIGLKYKKCFTGNPKLLINGKIIKVKRFGKALSIDLNNNYSLVIHIKMTGQLIYRGPNLKNPPDISDKVKDGLTGKHNHVTFHLNKKGTLYYVDYRKFGWMRVVKTSEIEKIDFVKKLGPEPLGGLNLETFKKIIGSTSRTIKTLLMDQSKVAGVGNIYANDALFLAKIHPEKKANKLKEKEIKLLLKSIETVLKKGLKYGGASEISFVTPDGTAGSYQDHSLIYGKDGERCPNKCGGVIEKVKVGGRGTYYCPNCQT